MGGLDVIICKELKDLYCKFGGAVYCASSTTGSIKKYHEKKAKQWLAMIMDVKPIIFKPEFTAKQFKALLYKHFTNEILFELPYILKISNSSCSKTVFEKQLKAGLKKWLADEV